MADSKDINILRDLAKQYAEISAKDIQDERRELWRQHNSLQRTRPLVYVRWFACSKEVIDPQLECEDPFYRAHERFLRHHIFQDFIGDDYIIEPWIPLRAVHVTPEGPFGPKYERIPSPEPGGSWMFDPPLKTLEDIDKVVEAHHVIDEDATARNHDRLQSAVGDIVPVCLSRAPLYVGGHASISMDLAYLRGLEQVMWDMVENPEWLHDLSRRLSEGIERAQAEAEAAGDWRLCDHQNQAMSYSRELEDPSPNGKSVSRNELWGFFMAQEMAQVSPAMHEEFVLNYQKPFMARYGLVAYGCCEDLTHKIDMLRKLPNLRRIAVTPVADVAKCAEQIGRDYVFSWRPNPAEMICCGFDPDLIRRIVRDAMDKSRECHVDITLKDIQTVQNKPGNLREWVNVVREISDEYA